MPLDLTSRRDFVRTSAGALAGAALAPNLGTLSGCAGAGGGVAEGVSPSAPATSSTAESSMSRQPVVFLPHGGGPWPFVEMGFDRRECSELATYLRGVADVPRQRPRALLVISAHWEAPVPTVSSSPAPPMLYDYYGFPPESYTLQWPAPGAPALAARVRGLVEAAGFASADDPTRGYDHGTFVPLKLTYPDADVPVVQLSLVQGLDPARHLALGRALQPLRDEGVFIVGSGMSYHDLRSFFSGRGRAASEAFDGWLRTAATLPQAEREAALAAWAQAPAARACHPREEHLLPLMVVAGAAGADTGTLAWSGTMMGNRISAFHYGA